MSRLANISSAAKRAVLVMTDDAFPNVYDDQMRAEAYSKLEFPGTYFLAYRDLPMIIREHARGGKALDFGCGAGRSTRFLQQLDFDVEGVDVSVPMLERARGRDPQGKYILLSEGGLGSLPQSSYDLVLSAFTFDNVPTMEEKVALFQGLKNLLRPSGRIINVVSSPEIYLHEWASFSTKDFPQNRSARSGERVFIVMLDVEDRRPVEDVLWTNEDYDETYQRAGLRRVKTYMPLGKETEPYSWVSETKLAPWVIDVLAG